MRYLLLIFLSFFSVSALACSCFVEGSFCNHIQSNYFAENGIVCIVESTGNAVGDYNFSAAEVKIVDLLFGEIQSGSGSYLNTDSTIWIIAGQGATCYESAFIFSNPGDQFVVAPIFGEVYAFFDAPEIGYSLFLCTHDVFRYQDTMTGLLVNDFLNYPYYDFEPSTITADQLPLLVNNCTNCMLSLNLPGSHDFPSIYRASSTILSTATINSDITYKANDRITLSNGFKTNLPYDFSIIVDECN